MEKEKVEESQEKQITKVELNQFIHLSEAQILREKRGLKSDFYNSDKIMNCKTINGFLSYSGGNNNRSQICINQKRTLNKNTKNETRWLFDIVPPESVENVHAYFKDTVYKCPGIYNRLGFEMNAWCDRFASEYNIFFAKFTNKLLIRTKHQLTYKLEGRAPPYTMEIPLDEFLSKLSKFFDDNIRFSMHYTPPKYVDNPTDGKRQLGDLLLIRNFRSSECYRLSCSKYLNDNNKFLEIMNSVLNDLDTSAIKFLCFHTQRIIIMHCQTKQFTKCYAFRMNKNKRENTISELAFISELQIDKMYNYNKLDEEKSLMIEMIVYQDYKMLPYCRIGDPEEHKTGFLKIFSVDMLYGFNEIVRLPYNCEYSNEKHKVDFIKNFGFRRANDILSIYINYSSFVEVAGRWVGDNDRFGIFEIKKVAFPISLDNEEDNQDDA